ncbi:hypothetical protein Tco_0794602 [Tanacetum coccineum]
MHSPLKSHLNCALNVLKYLKGAPGKDIRYKHSDCKNNLNGYSDADWAKCLKTRKSVTVAYIDSDYVGASLDRKSTTGGCQFLGCRLISWQCKKQIVVANFTTEAEYVAALRTAKKGARFMMRELCKNRQSDLVRKRIERSGELKNRKRVEYIKNRQSDLVRKRIERSSELKNKKRVEYIKNRQSDLVRKRIERSGELKNKKRVEYTKNRQSVWNGIGVNVGDSKLMLLGINLILMVKVNAARHNLLLLLKVNAVEGRKVYLLEDKQIPSVGLETASQIQRDAVTTKTKTASQDLTTASEYTTQPII